MFMFMPTRYVYCTVHVFVCAVLAVRAPAESVRDLRRSRGQRGGDVRERADRARAGERAAVRERAGSRAQGGRARHRRRLRAARPP